MGGLLQTLRNLGPARLAAIGGAAVVLLGLMIFLATRFSNPTMGLLYANLSMKDSGAVAQKLDAMNVPYQVRGDGTILAPADQVPRLRLSMAQDGLPHDGSIGYELFDKPEGLGTTDFVQNINQMRALEGELERTIDLIDSIDSARVHLVLPQHELFSRNTQEPSASILLKVAGNAELSRQQVAAIQNLVATAVPGLKPYRVSIVDQNGNLLARGTDDPSQGLDVISDTDQQRTAYENKLSRSVEELLSRSLGDGHARVDVTADMDFDKVTTDSEVYDPNGQVVRSTQTVSDNNTSSDNSADQAISVQTNLPDGQQTQGGGSNGSASKDVRDEETTNYEISKNSTVQTREAGVVKRLSVAVLVDGTYTYDKDGQPVYHPQSADDMKKIQALVESAIGADKKRGDQVQVVNMQFASAENITPIEPAIIFGLNKTDLFRIFETLVLAIVALLVLLLVVRPLVNRGLEAMRESQADRFGDGLMPAGSAGALTGPNLAALTARGGAVAPIEEEEEEEEIMVDISKVEGRVKASSMRKIGEIVDKHPEEAVAIIRNWMYRGGA